MREFQLLPSYNDEGELLQADGTVYTEEEQRADFMDTVSIIFDFIPGGSKLALYIEKYMGRFGTASSIASAKAQFMEGVDGLWDAIKELISEALGVVGDWETWEEFKQLVIAGIIEGALDEINKNLQARYEWMPSITLEENTVDALSVGIGNWMAEVVNFKLSEGLGREVSPFTSFYPPVNIVDELDVFLVDEINTKTQLNLSSIVKNPDLATELKDQVQEKFAQAISTKLAEQKARMVDKMAEMEIYGTSKQMRLQTIDSIIAEVQDMILQKKVIGFSFDGKQYMQQQYKKMLNRKHQKAYRRLHREQRTWVLRDEPLPP